MLSEVEVGRSSYNYAGSVIAMSNSKSCVAQKVLWFMGE